MEFSVQSILITGGTGSFGRRFVRRILAEYPHLQRVCIFSRDEYKQAKLARQFPKTQYPALEFVLGDVRDVARLTEAMQGIDAVIHAAALKQVDTGERNPSEFIRTNIGGAENVIQAARAAGVKKVIALSSDKAVNPVSLYGGTKLCADKLFIHAGTQAHSDTTFAVVRYGNVMGARGSVVPIFLEYCAAGSKTLPITHPDMTRFSVPVGLESDLVLYALTHARGGEIFVPQAPSYRLLDLAAAVMPDFEPEYIGLRPGEKLHEELLTPSEACYTHQVGDYFVVYPENYRAVRQGQPIPTDFHYASNTNTAWLDIAALRAEINAYQSAEG